MSFGFGQMSGEVLVVHPDYLLSCSSGRSHAPELGPGESSACAAPRYRSCRWPCGVGARGTHIVDVQLPHAHERMRCPEELVPPAWPVRLSACAPSSRGAASSAIHRRQSASPHARTTCRYSRARRHTGGVDTARPAAGEASGLDYTGGVLMRHSCSASLGAGLPRRRFL